MTYDDKVCECCGHYDHLMGIASSGIGAFSILWCALCLAMEAEPKWAVDATRGVIEDGDEPDPDIVPLIYYDRETDRYVDTHEGPITIDFTDGFRAVTRKEAGEHLTQIENSRKKPTPSEVSDAAADVLEDRKDEQIAEITETLIEMWDDAHKETT